MSVEDEELTMLAAQRRRRQREERDDLLAKVSIMAGWIAIVVGLLWVLAMLVFA